MATALAAFVPQRQFAVATMWHFIGSLADVPDDCDLVVAALNGDGLHALEFRCRCKDGCWINAATGRLIEIRPTHWRYWES
jgi:hypothetical protein